MDLGVIGWEDVEWMHLAQNNDRWQALLNTVMNLSSIKGREFRELLSDLLLACQESLCSTDSVTS